MNNFSEMIIAIKFLMTITNKNRGTGARDFIWEGPGEITGLYA